MSAPDIALIVLIGAALVCSIAFIASKKKKGEGVGGCQGNCINCKNCKK